MDKTLTLVEQATNTLLAMLPQLVAVLLVLVGMYYLGRTAGNLVLKILRRSELSSTHQQFFRKLVIVLFMVIAVSIALNILELRAASMGLLTGGGITALAFGIAFKDIGENILAGIYMAFSKPFRAGDLIATGNYEGEVKNVELRHTHIRTYEGSDIYIPNAMIFKEPLINYTRDGLRRHAFTIGIDYGDDAQKACDLLKKAVTTVDHILDEPSAVTSIHAFTPAYVDLKVYYWVNTFDSNTNIWTIKNTVMDICRTTLLNAGYTFSSNVTTANVLTVPEPVKIIPSEK